MRLSLERIKEYLTALGKEDTDIRFYDSTDSTNTRARECGDHPTPGSAVVFLAREQSGGRGRRGRSFSSPEGGIYISFLITPRAGENPDPGRLTPAAAVSLLSPIERECGIAPMLKWVNDLYVGDKKIAGILTEGVFDSEGRICSYVIGMGINVYKNVELCESVPVAATLEDVSDREIDINRLTASVIQSVLSYRDPEKTLRIYRERSMIIGKCVEVLDPSGSYLATAISVGEDYSLTVKRADNGEEKRLFTGDVSIRWQST